jgi:Zn-dependent peptidase ImmA (M78 family)
LIYSEVEKIVKRYDSNDPKEVLKEMGVKIIYSPLGGKFAHKTTYKRVPVITIDDSLNDYDERYILAHELAHVVLHKGQSTTFYRSYGFGNVPKIEREANEFATLLLTYGKKYMNRYSILQEEGIPLDMERFL